MGPHPMHQVHVVSSLFDQQQKPAQVRHATAAAGPNLYLSIPESMDLLSPSTCMSYTQGAVQVLQLPVSLTVVPFSKMML